MDFIAEGFKPKDSTNRSSKTGFSHSQLRIPNHGFTTMDSQPPKDNAVLHTQLVESTDVKGQL